MRTTSLKLSAAVLAFVLTFTLAAVPASAMPRDGGPGRDQPIVRIIKQLLKHFGIGTNADELSVPRP